MIEQGLQTRRDQLRSLMPSPVIVSLDMDSTSEAMKLARTLKGKVGAFKIGPRLLLRAGPAWANELAKLAPLFIDFKFFDIPSTTLAAVETAFELGATFVTIHALNGPNCLRVLGELEFKLNQIRPFVILGVTLLTSFEEGQLSRVLKPEPFISLVNTLSRELEAARIGGLVCSPHELSGLQDIPLFKVTPGIRTDLSTADLQDQVRVMTPTEALRLGADALVIGRPIIQAPSPEQALERVLAEL